MLALVRLQLSKLFHWRLTSISSRLRVQGACFTRLSIKQAKRTGFTGAEAASTLPTMAAPLVSSFCSARFASGDRLGQALATLATSPYFVIYHMAVLVHARRELHMAFILVGTLLSSALSSAIKKLLKDPRPAATCGLLNNCHKHGMPSSHSTVMAFAATTCLLVFLHRSRLRASTTNYTSAARAKTPGARKVGGGRVSMAAKFARAVQLLEVQGLALLTAAVAAGRIYLGYHSVAQVIAGLLLGMCCAVAWWCLTLAICQRWSAPLLRFAPLRALHFRNTLGCPDVHAAEADLFKL